MQEILVTSAVFSGLATFFVALRFYTRLGVVHNSGKDDWAIAASMVFAWISFAFLTQEIRYGLGKDMDTLSLETLENQLKALWLSIPFYNLSLIFTKASILFFYLRMFPVAKFVLWANITMGIIVVYGLWAVLSAIFNCLPVNAFWDVTITGGCIPKGFLWYFNAGMNIVTDLLILALPLPVLSHLQLRPRQKIGIFLVFATGGFTCVTSVIRLKSLVAAADSINPTKDDGPIALWSSIEMNMGIICSCLPALQPLIKRLFPFMGSGSRSRSVGQQYRQWHTVEAANQTHVSTYEAKEFDRYGGKPQKDKIVVTQELTLESSNCWPQDETASESGLVLRDMSHNRFD